MSADWQDPEVDWGEVWRQAVLQVAARKRLSIADAEDSVQAAVCAFFDHPERAPAEARSPCSRETLVRVFVAWGVTRAEGERKRESRRQALARQCCRGPECEAGRAEERDWARWFLQTLERIEDRQAVGCLYAKVLNGRSVREISADLGCRDGAVYRMLEELRERSRLLAEEPGSGLQAGEAGGGSRRVDRP